MSKEEKHLEILNQLLESFEDHEDLFWGDIDLDALEMSDDEAEAINLTALMQFAAKTFGSVSERITKEQWMHFCAEVFKGADFLKAQEEINTRGVGEA